MRVFYLNIDSSSSNSYLDLANSSERHISWIWFLFIGKEEAACRREDPISSSQPAMNLKEP